MRVLDGEAGVALDARAGGGVVETIAPHRHAGARIARITRETLLATVVAAPVVVGVVREGEGGRVVGVLHLQAAAAAGRAAGGHAQRLGAAAAAALLTLEV